MAEGISNAIIQATVERPVSQAYEEIKSALVDFKSNVESLQNTRTTIEAVLLEAESVVESNHVQQDALEKLSYQLDRLVDFLDAREARAMRKEVMGGSWFIKEARLFFSPSNQLVARFMDARKVKDIRNRLDSISRDHAQFGSIVSMPPVRLRQPWEWSIQTAASHIITDVVVGRDGDKENIISIITSNLSVASETLSVASIVGIGGVGKTTLAHYVYCDERVKHTFDVRFWVDVTQDFDVKEVLQKIGACAINDEELLTDEMDQPYHYHDQFIRAISGKKYLLVLDNMWDQEGLRLKWINLQTWLDRFGARGSQVLITTRNEKVAGIMNSKYPYMLKDLTEGNSWLLFQQIAFTGWQEPGVEAIGKEIAKMCPNVPLVIRSIAGLLAGKRTIQEWQAFRDDQLANFASYGSDIMQTLKLSFDQLDARSKHCVIYCSLFSKGFRFYKDATINLWIALGYVEPQYRNQSLEEAGEEILINLINSGFLQRYYPDMFGFFKLVVIHDVMHELVVSLAGYKYKTATSKTDEFDKRVRHVSVGKVGADTSWEVPSSLFKIKHLNSFIVAMEETCKIEVRNWSICDDLLGRFIGLRVLILRGVLVEKLPRSLGELISLRYLDLSRTAIRQLPNSVTRLVNLLSLHLYRCEFLRELPEDMSKLVKLRHLELRLSSEVTHMPTRLGRLTNLITLDMFVVSEQSSRSESKAKVVGGLADLKELNNIKGELKIKVRRESRDIVLEARETNLKMKEKLTQFSIDFEYSTKEDEMVLEGLHPHANLKVLGIRGYGGERLPSWMMYDHLHTQLPNLVMIYIQNCKSCRHFCSLGRLRHLKAVYLNSLDNLEYIESNNSSDNANNSDNSSRVEVFLSLERLDVKGVPKLKGWKMPSIDNQDQQPVVEWKPTWLNLRHLIVDSVDVAITVAGGLFSVERLSIHKKLTSQPHQQRPTLALLNSCFPNLRELVFHDMDKLVVIPDEFRDFSSLESLDTYGCNQLQAIPEWIDRLTSLKTIKIHSCPKLDSLPHQISNLSKLQSLVISKCSSLLEQKCQRPTGEYWPYIQHIPQVNITSADSWDF